MGIRKFISEVKKFVMLREVRKAVKKGRSRVYFHEGNHDGEAIKQVADILTHRGYPVEWGIHCEFDRRRKGKFIGITVNLAWNPDRVSEPDGWFYHPSIYLYIVKAKLKRLSFFCAKIIQAGAVAAPVAGQVLGEILPYLELKEDNEKTKADTTVVVVPDVKYKTLEEAEKILKESGLNIKYETGEEKINKKEKVITSQVPSGGISINSGSIVLVNLE